MTRRWVLSLRLHDRGEREDRGAAPGRISGRRHRAGDQTARRKIVINRGRRSANTENIMSKIISCEQLRRLARHHAGIGEILTEALLSPDHREPMPETIFGEIREFCDPPACGLSACGHEASAPAPAPFGEPVVTSGWREEELRRREREMGRLCGRWMSAPNRCGIEIVRAGGALRPQIP